MMWISITWKWVTIINYLNGTFNESSLDFQRYGLGEETYLPQPLPWLRRLCSAHSMTFLPTPRSSQRTLRSPLWIAACSIPPLPSLLWLSTGTFRYFLACEFEYDIICICNMLFWLQSSYKDKFSPICSISFDWLYNLLATQVLFLLILLYMVG